MNHFERDFEKEFERICPLFKTRYYKIPDVLPIDKDGNVIKSGQIHISRKLPFDGNLITPSQNYCLEFKYQNNQLADHQIKTMIEINKINMSYYVVRKKVLKKGTFYTIEQGNPYSVSPIPHCEFKTKQIEDLFLFFNDPDDSQQTMLDAIIPSKIKPKRRRVFV